MQNPTQYKVYAAHFPNGKKYVGITRLAFSTRIKMHKKTSIDPRYSKRKLSRAFQKHGFENVNFEIIDYANSIEEMKSMEIEYIKKYNSYKEGYNSTLGGDGVWGLKWAKENKEKGCLRRQKELSVPGAKEKLVKALLTNRPNKERLSEIAKNRYTKYKEIYDSNNIVQAEQMKTPKRYEESAIGGGAKWFAVYNKEGLFLGKFLTKRQVFECLGIKKTTIPSIEICVKGLRKNRQGYTFKYIRYIIPLSGYSRSNSVSCM